MEAKILRPLMWFALLEHRSEKILESRFTARHYYRKIALFDRPLTFDIRLEFAQAISSLMRISYRGDCTLPNTSVTHLAVRCV